MRELVEGGGIARISKDEDDFITLDTRQLKENAFDSCILSPLTGIGTTDTIGTTPRALGSTSRNFNAEHFFSHNDPDYTISTRDDIDANLEKRGAGAGSGEGVDAGAGAATDTDISKFRIDSTTDIELRDGGTDDFDLIDLRDSESPVMAPSPAPTPAPAPAMCVITSENASKFGQLEGARDRMELLRQRLQESKTRESVLSPMSMSQSSLDFGLNGGVSDLEEDSEGETTEKTTNTQSAYELKQKRELEQDQEQELEQQLASRAPEPPETSTSPVAPEMKLHRPKVTRGVAFRMRQNDGNVDKGQSVERSTAQSEENVSSDKLGIDALNSNSVEIAKEYQAILNPSYGAEAKKSSMKTIHSGDLSQDLSLDIEEEEMEMPKVKARSATIYSGDLSQDLSQDLTQDLEEKEMDMPKVKERSAVEAAEISPEKQEASDDLLSELPQENRKPDEESKFPQDEKPKVGDEKLHIPISELMGREGPNRDGTLDLYLDSEKERQLSQIQVLQSILLAEAASNSGASEFKTGDKSMFDLTRVKVTKNDIDGKKGSAGAPPSIMHHRFKMFLSGTIRKTKSAREQVVSSSSRRSV